MTAGWLAARGLEPWPTPELAITALIPQRPPLLLVNELLGARGGPRPAVAAALQITGDEPVLAGHFPGRPVWPGVYTIEGLAQTCALAGGLQSRGSGGAPVVLVAAVKVKLTGLLTPPARLCYFVELAAVVGEISHFLVEASSEGRAIATGSIDVVVRAEAP